MKSKLKEYINTVFADAERRDPHNQRLAELKEELLANLEDKYDDLIAAGRTPAAAYNIAIAGVGDISDLLDSVTGTPSSNTRHAETDRRAGANPDTRRNRRPLTREEQEVLEKYRRRSAVITPAAVALYILSTVPCIIYDHVGSVVLMFMMVATATAMLIYNYMSRPKFAGDSSAEQEDDEEDDETTDNVRPRRSPVYRAISGALWCLCVCIYLLVSFWTGYWHLTWLIFLVFTALDNIIKAIFDLRR